MTVLTIEDSIKSATALLEEHGYVVLKEDEYTERIASALSLGERNGYDAGHDAGYEEGVGSGGDNQW